MKRSGAQGIAFIVIGVVFIAIGSSGQRAFVVLGAAFAVIGLSSCSVSAAQQGPGDAHA